MRKFTALAAALTLAVLAGSAQAGTMVSFNDDATVPHTLPFGAAPVQAGDMLDVGSGAVVLLETTVFDQPSLEDLDAAHQLANGNWVFSTSTASIIDGTIYAPSELILWDPVGETASVFFDESNFATPAENIDAVFVIEGGVDDGDILFSTAAAATVGTNLLVMQPGDIVQIDPTGGVATLFFGQASLSWTGTAGQRNVDALHIDANGDLLLSVLISNGSLGGHTTLSQDIIRFDGAVGSQFLDGTALFDGTTANLNALTVAVPEPGTLALAGLALLALAARRTLRR